MKYPFRLWGLKLIEQDPTTSLNANANHKKLDIEMI